jgi:phage terminase small subunit
VAAKLTTKQKRFVLEYLVDSNGTKAAIRAGYSPNRASEIAYALMQKPHVRSAIEVAQAKQAKRLEITADRVKLELARIAFSNVRNVVSVKRETITYRGPHVNSEGEPNLIEVIRTHVELIPSDQWSDDAAGAVSEVVQTSTAHGENIKIKHHDKVKALELLAKHFGMLDKVEAPDDEQQNNLEQYKSALTNAAVEAWSGDENAEGDSAVPVQTVQPES